MSKSQIYKNFPNTFFTLLYNKLKYLLKEFETRRLNWFLINKNLLRNIFNDFLSLIDIQTNTIPIRIEVAQIQKSNISAIEKLLKEMYPKQAYRFEHHHAPELLGGFRVFIRERCLDYSLKSRLNRLSYQLKEA